MDFDKAEYQAEIHSAIQELAHHLDHNDTSVAAGVCAMARMIGFAIGQISDEKQRNQCTENIIQLIMMSSVNADSHED